MAGVPSSIIFHKFGSSSRPFTTSVAGTVHQCFYTRSRATSGASYGVRFQHYIAGAGGSGAAVRAYGFIKGASASVMGIEATGELNSATSSAVMNMTSTNLGCVTAGRFVCSIQIDPSTTGNASCLILDTDVKTALDPTGMVSHAYIRVRKSGAGTNIGNLFYFENVLGTASDTAVITTKHDTAAAATADWAIKVDVAGTPGWIDVSKDTPAN